MATVGAGVGVRVTVVVAVAGPELHRPAEAVTSTRTWSPVTSVLLVKVGPLATGISLTNHRKVGAGPALVVVAVKVSGVPGHWVGGVVSVTVGVTTGDTRTVTTLEIPVEQVPVPEVTRRRK